MHRIEVLYVVLDRPLPYPQGTRNYNRRLLVREDRLPSDNRAAGGNTASVQWCYALICTDLRQEGGNTAWELAHILPKTFSVVFVSAFCISFLYQLFVSAFRHNAPICLLNNRTQLASHAGLLSNP